MADIPHFKIPFQVTNGTVATVEQDSDEEILTNVETVLRTPTGSRIEQPDFGLEDTTFTTSATEIETACRDALNEWEDRAQTLPEAEIREQIATVQIGVTVGRP